MQRQYFPLSFIIIIIVLFFIIISTVSAATNPKTGNSVLPDASQDPVIASSPHVLLLFDDNFEQEIAKYEWVLVHFYASWGGNDVPLGATLSEVADILSVEKEHKLNTVKIVQIEGVIGPSKSDPSIMAQKYQVQGFPSVKLFFEGNFVEDYLLYDFDESLKSVEEIAQFMKEKATKVAIT